MRIQLAVIGLLATLLLGGCSYFGGGSKKETAAAPTPSFDILQMQRDQWRQLAEQGDAEAEYQLGMTYCCGYGPGHTDTTARKWLCRAALQGHEQAQYQLGRMYGYQIKKRPFSTPSYVEYAYLWYGLAAAQGNQLATGYLASMEQLMSPQQIAEARNWQTHPADVMDCS